MTTMWCAFEALDVLARHREFAVVADIGDVVGHDQVVLRIDGSLTLQPTMAVPLPLVPMARASGSVSEILHSSLNFWQQSYGFAEQEVMARMRRSRSCTVKSLQL